MEHNSYNVSPNEVQFNDMSTPKSATLNYIRQFARTCVAIQGCAISSMVILN